MTLGTNLFLNLKIKNILISHSSVVVEERVQLSTPSLSLHGKLQGELFPLRLHSQRTLLRMDQLRMDLLTRLGK